MDQKPWHSLYFSALLVYQELMGVFSWSTTYFVGKRALPFGVVL
jgi:hypothetical protein